MVASPDGQCSMSRRLSRSVAPWIESNRRADRTADRITPQECRNAWTTSGVGGVQIQTAGGEDRLGGLRDDRDRVDATLHVERVDAPALELEQREDGHDPVDCRNQEQRAPPVPREVHHDPPKESQPVEREEDRKRLAELDRVHYGEEV